MSVCLSGLWALKIHHDMQHVLFSLLESVFAGLPCFYKYLKLGLSFSNFQNGELKFPCLCVCLALLSTQKSKNRKHLPFSLLLGSYICSLSAVFLHKYLNSGSSVSNTQKSLGYSLMSVCLSFSASEYSNREFDSECSLICSRVNIRASEQPSFCSNIGLCSLHFSNIQSHMRRSDVCLSGPLSARNCWSHRWCFLVCSWGYISTLGSNSLCCKIEPDLDFSNIQINGTGD